MDANEVALLSVKGTVAGQQHVHTLHFKQKAGSPATALSVLTGEWDTRCGPTYRGLFHTSANPVIEVHAKQVCGGIPLDADHILTPASAAGTRIFTGQNGAPFLAQLVDERSAFSGRSRRGRFFLGGLLEDDFQQDVILTTSGLRGADIVGYTNALMTAFGPASSLTVYDLVIYSKKLASAIPPPQCQDTVSPVTQLVPSIYLTTMRSRKLGHGS